MIRTVHLFHYQWHKVGHTTRPLLQALIPLLLRVYLAPIFIYAGMNKLSHFESTVAWFGNSDWGLGLPFPFLLSLLAITAEILGGTLLLLGLAVRIAVLPLLITMIVAAVTVHWEYGWSALADPELIMPWEWRPDLIDAAVERRNAARSLLQQHGNYQWLTGAGSITVLKNGVEFSATYALMLLTVLLIGAGRWFSVDYWLGRWWEKRYSEESRSS